MQIAMRSRTVEKIYVEGVGWIQAPVFKEEDFEEARVEETATLEGSAARLWAVTGTELDNFRIGLLLSFEQLAELIGEEKTVLEEAVASDQFSSIGALRKFVKLRRLCLETLQQYKFIKDNKLYLRSERKKHEDQIRWLKRAKQSKTRAGNRNDRQAPKRAGRPSKNARNRRNGNKWTRAEAARRWEERLRWKRTRTQQERPAGVPERMLSQKEQDAIDAAVAEGLDGPEGVLEPAIAAAGSLMRQLNEGHNWPLPLGLEEKSPPELPEPVKTVGKAPRKKAKVTFSRAGISMEYDRRAKWSDE